MIITRTEVKSLLQMSPITDTTYDTFIDMNIPIVEQAICDYCNTDFVEKQFDYFSSSAISFTNSTNSINFTDIGNKKLVANDSIRIYRSLRNNQSFTVSTVSTDSIVLNTIDTITDEDAGEGVFITKVKYPTPLKIIVAKMIKYTMGISDLDFNIKSEKIDDYSVTFADNVYGYPQSIMSQLNAYRHAYKIDLFNSNRGF